jgi:PhzF family phenazine biosynthesis protein
MARCYRVFQVDAFTRERFKGNPAGVVLDAAGLSDAQMQDIARELNNSETSFVLPPTGSDHHVWVRFFTPTTEVPICGHATIAAHYVHAKETNATPGRIFQRTGAGILPIDIAREGSDYRIFMTQGEISFGKILEGNECETLLVGLGIGRDDIDGRCPIQIVSTGHSKVMIGLRSSATLHALSPNLQILTDLSRRIGCNGYFPFTFDTGDEQILTQGRMFAPAIGIAEDPVTGNANGPLGAYIVEHRLCNVGIDTFSFTARQGTAIRREGTVYVRVEILGDNPRRVIIGGDAVNVFETEIIL